MLKKLFAFLLFSFVFCGFAAAQKPDAPKQLPQKKIEPMIFETVGETSFLGVQTRDITKETASKFGLAEARGVAVEKVSENSPAEKAGLQNGDVILKFNGEDVTSVRKLTRLIGEVAPDHKAQITVFRNGAERELTAVMGRRDAGNFQNSGMLEKLWGLPGIPEYPTAPFPPANENNPNVFIFRGDQNRQIGVSVTPLTKQLGDFLGVADGRGLLVTNVRENSPAAKAGLRAGDVIIEVEGKKVGDALDLIRLLNEKKEGEAALTIVREKKSQTFRVAPETLKIEKGNLDVLKNLSEDNQNR